jgi:hypothetical protein
MELTVADLHRILLRMPALRRLELPEPAIPPKCLWSLQLNAPHVTVVAKPAAQHSASNGSGSGGDSSNGGSSGEDHGSSSEDDHPPPGHLPHPVGSGSSSSSDADGSGSDSKSSSGSYRGWIRFYPPNSMWRYFLPDFDTSSEEEEESYGGEDFNTGHVSDSN